MMIKICIAGKNNIAIDIAEYILRNYPHIELCAIFNSNDDGKNGFQRSFKAFCHLNHIKNVILEDIYMEKELLFLSLEFDKIIKPRLFASSELFNIHFSLLPEYKGMYTSALPILHGKNYTGVTLHKIDKGIDTGDVIEQTKFEICDDLKSEDLYGLYISHGITLIKKNLDQIIKRNYSVTPQTAIGSTYFSPASIDYRNLSIDLKQTAFQIQRQINAFVFPAYQLPVVKGFSIFNTQITYEKSLGKIGEIISDDYFFLEINTIDYNIRLYKDLRNELFEMAKTGNLSALKHFIDSGYDIHQRSKEGWDIAIIAAYNDQFEFLEYLLSHCAWDANTKNNNGTTLAMYLMTRASKHSDSNYLEHFLNNKNIDLSSPDYMGKDIWEYADQYGNQNIINLIKKHK